MEETGDNQESGYRGYTNPGYRREMKNAAIKRADAEAEWIWRPYKSRVPQREEKRGNKESGYRGYTNQGYRRGSKRATIKRVGTEAVQIQGTPE